ncbi:MAG: hypothetical protein ABFD60_01740 [Bryobacteraceae bacterium]
MADGRIVEDAPTPYTELGISGVARYGGISRVYEEFLRELQGPAGMKLLREQRDNCPITGAFLFAAEYLARGTTFRVEPSAQPGVDKRMAAAVAERIRGAMFDDLETTWPDTISEALTMLPFGWAAMEMVFKKCQGSAPAQAAPLETPQLAGVQPEPGKDAAGPEGQGPAAAQTKFYPSRFKDGMIGWRKWGLRAQETMFMWEWDDESNPLVLQQMAPPDFKIRRIPLSKCLHFRTQTAKNNPEGRSILRNSVPSYLYCKNIQWVEGVGIERDLAGYPYFQVKEPDPAKGMVPPDIWNKNNPEMVILMNQLKTLVKSVRRDEQEGMVLPYWLNFTLASTGSRRAFDTNAVITRYQQRIAMTVMADFIMLGHEAVGSKALASTKSYLFTRSLTAFLTTICSTVNRFGIPLLMKLNGLPAELTPTLVCGDVDEVPLESLGQYISDLAGAGAPLFPDAELEEELRRRGSLPSAPADGALEFAPGAQEEEDPIVKPKPTVATADKRIGKRLARHAARRY